MSRLSRSALIIAAVIIWLFGIVAAYFWAHKPFDLGIVIGLGRTLASVLVWLMIVSVAAGLGYRMVGGWLGEDGPLARMVMSAGLGLGALSLSVLALGLVGLLRATYAWALMLVLALWSLPGMRAGLADLRMLRYSRPKGPFQWWISIYSVASLLLPLFSALAPATAWDALVYHLTGPRLFVEAGRVVHSLDLPYLGFPQVGEMQYALGLLLMGEQVAALIHYGYGLLTLAVVWVLARRGFDQGTAGLAVALLLSVPTLLTLMGSAYVDVTLLFYATAAWYGLLRWRDSRSDRLAGRRWLVLTGMFCGLSCGVKYTAVGVPLAVALGLVWASRRDGLWRLVKRLGLVGGVAVALTLPWLIENQLTAGTPIYPFFSSAGVYWDSWRQWWYDRPGTGLIATAPLRLLVAPFEATILGTEGSVMYDATIGPLLLGCGVLLLPAWQALSFRERAIAGYLLLFIGVSYALWIVGLARTALLVQTRLLLPAFGCIAVIGAGAVSRLRLRQLSLDVAWLARAVVSMALGLLLFSAVIGFVQKNPVPVALGLETTDAYLARRLGWYSVAVKDVDARLTPEQAVLFLWEPRSYHCQAECWPDALLDRWLHTTYLYGHDAHAIAEVWRAQGFTHVLINRVGYQTVVDAGFDPVRTQDQQTLEALFSDEMMLVADYGGSYELYAFLKEDLP